jgi:hypothetical protein
MSQIIQFSRKECHLKHGDLICIAIRFIGNCNYSLKSMLVEMGAAMVLYEVAYVLVEVINI